MKIFIVLIITFITSHTYSFDLKLDLEGVSDALEKVTDELSENLKIETDSSTTNNKKFNNFPVEINLKSKIYLDGCGEPTAQYKFYKNNEFQLIFICPENPDETPFVGKFKNISDDLSQFSKISTIYNYQGNQYEDYLTLNKDYAEIRWSGGDPYIYYYSDKNTAVNVKKDAEKKQNNTNKEIFKKFSLLKTPSNYCDYNDCSKTVLSFCENHILDFILFEDLSMELSISCQNNDKKTSLLGSYESTRWDNFFNIYFSYNGNEVHYVLEINDANESSIFSPKNGSPSYYKTYISEEQKNLFQDLCNSLNMPSLDKENFLSNYDAILQIREEDLDRNTIGPYEEELLFSKNNARKLTMVAWDGTFTEGSYDWKILKYENDIYYIYLDGIERNKYDVREEDKELYVFNNNKVEKRYCDEERRIEKYDLFKTMESEIMNWGNYNFQTKLIGDFIPEKIKKIKQEQTTALLNKEIDKSKGGYKNFYFDMNFAQIEKEVLNKCEEGTTKFTNRNVFNDGYLKYYYPVDETNLEKPCLEFGGKRRSTAFYLNSNKKLDKIVMRFDRLENQLVTYFKNNESGNSRYDEIVGLYDNSDKYELIRYPTEIEIDDFNNQNLTKMLDNENLMLELNTVYKNKNVGNLVVISLNKSTLDGGNNFYIQIKITHHSLESSNQYLKMEKNSNIDSDDL